jgi:hypothetical protein
VDKLDDVRGGEAVRVQDRFRATFAIASRKQFERPDAVWLEIALAAAGTRESARRASQRSPYGVSRCRNDAIPARSGVIQGFSPPHRAHRLALTPLARSQFLLSQSKGWSPATACAPRQAHFALDYVTLETYDSGSNPKWV